MHFKPVIRFLSNYKHKCLSKILGFNRFVSMVDNPKYKDLLNIPELKTLDDLLNKPALFLTITMGNDSPLNTVLKYKIGWKRFYNNLRHLAKEYGFNLDYCLKEESIKIRMETLILLNKTFCFIYILICPKFSL